jgi:hypothetical protein
MKLDEALALVRATPETRRALLLLVDESIAELEKRLLTSSVDNSAAVYAARLRLDGAVAMRASLVRQIGAPPKP